MCSGLVRLQFGASSLGRVGWCVPHTIGNGGGWGSVRNSQGALFCLFAGRETSELEEVAVYQRGVSRKVETLHTWVAVMVKTGDGEKRDNFFNGYPFHAL